VLTRAEDQRVRIFATDGRSIGELRVPHQVMHRAAFWSDGSRILTVEDSSVVRLWRLDESGSRELVPLRGQVQHLSLSPDGRRVLAVMQDGTARAISRDGSGLVRLAGHRAYRGAITDDGRVVTVSADGLIRAFKEDGAGGAALPQRARTDVGPVLSRSGNRVLVEKDLGKVLVINTDGTGEIELPKQSSVLTSAAFSPDDRSVAVGHHNHILSVDLSSKTTQPVVKDVNYVSGLSWNADGVLWGALGDELRRWTRGPDGAWKSAGATDYTETVHAFQPSGREPQAVLAGEKRALSLAWLDGRRVPLRGYAAGYASAVLSADARYLVAADDQKVRIWDLDRESLRRAMWLSPARCLPPGARRSLLGEEQAQAERGEALCTELRSCMKDEGTQAPAPERYERCYAAFRKAQGLSASPRRPDLGALRAGDDSGGRSPDRTGQPDPSKTP
jgi:WD40 repeat protein